MKSLFAICVTALTASLAWANNPSYVAYNCTPTTPLSDTFKVGLSELKQIKNVTVEYDLGGNNISIDAEVVTAEDLMNSHGKPVKSKLVTEKYDIKELKTGTFMELSPQAANQLNFTYTMFHFLNLDVVTAGPVPPGIYNATADLVLISTYPENYSPQTGVLKLPLTCKAEIRY